MGSQLISKYLQIVVIGDVNFFVVPIYDYVFKSNIFAIRNNDDNNDYKRTKISTDIKLSNLNENLATEN